MENEFDIKIIITDKSNDKDITIIVNSQQVAEIKQIYDYNLVTALIDQGIEELKTLKLKSNEQG